MALGGGTFTAQNKTLPGVYHNFVSLASANATLSERGIATMPLELDWGVEGKVFEVTNTDFHENSERIFGYPYNHSMMKGLRDLFKNITTLYAYRLNVGGTPASNDTAVAKYSGVRGNDIKIVIQKNVDDTTMYDVKTVLGNAVVDVQTIKEWDSITGNDYVTFLPKDGIEETAGKPLTGGTNGTVTGESHQNYIDKIESYTFNALGVITTDDNINALYAMFCKRLREEMGVKFQAVLYNMPGDYEGIVNVKNKVKNSGYSEACLVYWVTGIIAGCPVNKSNLNKKYDGEFDVETNYTQAQLIQAIKNGEFTLHNVGADIRVLEDINSLVTVTGEKGDIFKDNQSIRVIDQIANDTAVLFNTKYLGVVPNDTSGRISLWADLVKQRNELQTIRAIENFKDADLTVEKGEGKKSVVVKEAIEVVNAMAKLYVTTTIA
jgi:hypothetical protein